MQDPISIAWIDIMSVMYVDNADLYIMNVCINLHFDLLKET